MHKKYNSVDTIGWCRSDELYLYIDFCTVIFFISSPSVSDDVPWHHISYLRPISWHFHEWNSEFIWSHWFYFECIPNTWWQLKGACHNVHQVKCGHFGPWGPLKRHCTIFLLSSEVKIKCLSVTCKSNKCVLFLFHLIGGACKPWIYFFKPSIHGQC